MEYINRNDAITAIRASLKQRSGKQWSVKGGRGTAWGWIHISAPPARCGQFGEMTDTDRTELGTLLGLGRPAHTQYVQVAASPSYYREYMDRAAGRTPSVFGQQYWD